MAPGQHFILLVEDDPHVCELVTDMIEELGYNSVSRPNAAEALVAMEEGIELLTKPSRMEQLRAKLSRLLERA